MLSLATFNDARARLQANYKGKADASVIPWANIISLLMSLLGGCFKPTPTPTPAGVRELLATNDTYLAYAVRTELRDSYGWGAWRTYDGPGVCEAVKLTVAGADDAFLQAAINEAT